MVFPRSRNRAVAASTVLEPYQLAQIATEGMLHMVCKKTYRIGNAPDRFGWHRSIEE